MQKELISLKLENQSQSQNTAEIHLKLSKL